MKLSRLLSAFGLLGALGAPWAGATPGMETATEFHGRGDFDGDSREDLVIVEKATGVYRLAYQTAPGTYSWAEARASGVTGVSGLSVGRVLATTRDALVLTSPEANRANVLGAASTTVPETPASWFLPSVGPILAVALDIGGAGNTAHHDLFGVTVWNGSPTPVQQALARSTAGGLSPLGTGAAAAAYSRGARVRLKTGSPEVLGLYAPGGGNSFRAFDLASGSLALIDTATGLPDDARFLFHPFAPGSLSQFLFFQPGKPELQLRAVTEPVPGTLKFGSAVTFTLARTIDAVEVLPGATGGRLLVLHDDGASAAIYDFNGVSAPVLVQSFTPGAGRKFTGGAGTGDLNSLLFTGSPADGRSAAFAMHQWDGTKYVAGPAGSLPDGSPYAASANVFVFQAEPFVNPSPVLVQRLAAGDWTSQPSVSGAPLKINVVVETFGGVDAGLGTPTARGLGDVTPPGAHALGNQYTPGISLFSFVPPIGDEAVEVRISPAPGLQKTAIEVSLSASVAGATVRYRLNGAASWTTYSAPFALARDTTVDYYAQAPASDRKSVIHSATYAFAEAPSTLDSDHDGVPDFAELGLDANNNGTPDYAELGQGLDPVISGKDSDGDGFADLDEWIAGTNPYDDSSVPAAGSRLEDQSGFDLYLTPRPLDGTVPAPSSALAGANLRLHTLPGTLIQFHPATNLAAPAPVGIPTARMTNVAVDTKQRLLATGTEAHFAIQTASADNLIGRELVGLIPVPPLAAGVTVAYTLGGGTLKAEAAAWRSAAQAAAAAQPRVSVVRDLAPSDSLAGLLFEREVELLLQARGLDATNLVSLFGFRTADVDRYVPTQEELLALENEDAGQPAYRLVDVFAAISNAVVSPATVNAQRLRDLGIEVYRVSSVFNNGSPGAYPLPVEVLREFLRSGTLHSNYLAQTSLDAGQLAAAAAGVGEVLGLAPVRPKATLDLTVMSGAVTTDCTTLYQGSDPKSLSFADGSAFLFPESFELVPGTVVQVTGYTDLSGGGCPGDGIEVISAQVTSVPTVATIDGDGDLLPDAYECAFFGSTAARPYDDLDGDLFSNLQEFLDGTDPGDNLARGVTPVLLLPPVIQLTLKPNLSIGLTWSFPSAYVDHFNFNVMTATSLAGGFVNLPATVVPVGADTFEVQLPPPAGDTQFYVLHLELK